MDAQFQLGFELTNILNPITQAVSAFSSVAIIDAVRKAGSDVLTEVKLASFLGKNRIDPVLETHFRQVVTKPERNLISRYLEIALESGAGPTIQNALKHTALFSMIVQMSLLCFVHEHQPFANAMVEAIERIIRDFKGNPASLPDYPSLLSTMRVIQRETVAFQWSALFDSVERTFQDKLSKADSCSKPTAQKRKLDEPELFDIDRFSLTNRGLSFPILQALLLSLESLQRFSEERQIYIECVAGISTIVVWCYHVLGLSVKVSYQTNEVTFGDRPFNVLIKETSESRTSVTLIIPLSQDEPLFTLSRSELDPRFGPELRAKILNFGHAALRDAGFHDDGIWIQYLVVTGALTSSNRDCTCEVSSRLGPDNPESNTTNCNHDTRSSPGKRRILQAARMLFGLREFDEAKLKEVQFNQVKRLNSSERIAVATLVELLFSLSRIQPQDLEQCADMLFSIKTFRERARSMTAGFDIFDVKFPDIIESFEILTHYLLGQRHSDSYIAQALLVSDCGWSIFFDVADATDPSDVSICNLRMLVGAPSVEDASKNKVIKDRVLDGPTESIFLDHNSTILEAKSASGTSSVDFLPGVSAARRNSPLIGFRDGDAFLATQSFKWDVEGKSRQVHILGYRAMLELCNRYIWLPRCACQDTRDGLGSIGDGQAFVTKGSNVKTTLTKDLKDHEISDSEYAVCYFPNSTKFLKNDEVIWTFHVTRNPAARWLQMHSMVQTSRRYGRGGAKLSIRESNTCMPCAYKFLYVFGFQRTDSLVLL